MEINLHPPDAKSAAIAAAEEYAFYAGFVSVSLIVASIALFLFVRSDLRSSAIAAAALCVHPLWTVTDVWHDDGAKLRLASTVWIFCGCGAILAALIAVIRHRAVPRRRLRIRFTSMSLLMLTVLVAIVLMLVRPPLSQEIPVSRSLPALGLMVLMIIAMAPANSRRASRRPARVTIKREQDAAGGNLGPDGVRSTTIFRLTSQRCLKRKTP